MVDDDEDEDVDDAGHDARPCLALLFGLTSSDDQERLHSRNRAYAGPELRWP